MARLSLQGLRGPCRWSRGISVILVVSLTAAVLPPAAASPSAGPGRVHAEAAAAADDFSAPRAWRTFDALREGAPRAVVLRETEALGAALKRDDRLAMRAFASARSYIDRVHLGPVFQRRRLEAMRRYRARVASALRALRRIHDAATPALRRRAVGIARMRLAPMFHPDGRGPRMLSHTLLQRIPGNLPRIDAGAFRRAGLEDNPALRLADAGPFTFDALPGADDPAYLSTTDEVTLSAAVRAEASALGHDPVRIYDWVHDHIVWLPTWGATQDADLTLHSGRGNAMDIASLTIALLRASGIPARYVHGTVDVPAAAFRNWAGGFRDTAAAADLAASGGVPVTDVVSGGTVSKVRLEHVWVEAAIDYEPSRGAVNHAADSWVPLDPAFKQYEAVPGLDVQQLTAQDPGRLADAVMLNADAGPAGDWTQGLNPAAAGDAYADAVSRLQAYVAANPPAVPGAAGILGDRQIVPRGDAALPPALPNHVVVIGARYARLPAALEHRVAFSFGTPLGGDLPDPVDFSWPAINNHRVTLSFRPATPADEQALRALMPDGPVGTLDQLPASLPSYLFRVVPELKVDGKVVSSGAAVMPGEDVPFSYTVTMRGRGIDLYRKHVIAGAFLAIAVVGGSIDPARIGGVGSTLAALRETLSGAGPQGIALARESLLGGLFHAGVLGYFAQYMALSERLSRSQDAWHLLGPSTGTFGYEPTVQYAAGVPLAIGAGGAVLDIDRIAHVIGTDPLDTARRRLINLQCGAVSSALEQIVPQEMFAGALPGIQAVSAVSALDMANAQGQRIYHVTPANEADLLPNVRHAPATMAEIEAALAVGKEVITHAGGVSVPGWSGAGYIIMDPVTGDAAYKIGGGFNGGVVALNKLVSPIFTFWETWDLAVSGNVATEFTHLLKGAGSYLSLAAFMINTFSSCPHPGNALVVLAVFGALSVTMSKLVGALALSPLGGILMGMLVGVVVGQVIKGVKNIAC